MNVRVAIWTHHPGDILGDAINFITHGQAQHAGFIRGNGRIHELYLPTVRDRDILSAEAPFLKQFDIEGLTDEMSAKMERHFDAVLKVSGVVNYSIADLFRIILNRPKPADGSMVCSQYVFHMLNMFGLPPLARCTDDFITPRDLWISPRLIGPVSISPYGLLQECDLCHTDFPMREVELSSSSQMLCPKCRSGEPATK